MQTTKSLREALTLAWPDHKQRMTGALVASLTLGLAPYFPHAHIWKQLVNIARGTLTEPMDMFDLVLHGAPWVVLIVLLALFLRDGLSRMHTDRLEQL